MIVNEFQDFPFVFLSNQPFSPLRKFSTQNFQ